MKNRLKTHLTVLVVACALFLSSLADAQEQKGFLIRLWERVSSRFRGQPEQKAELPEVKEAETPAARPEMMPGPTEKMEGFEEQGVLEAETIIDEEGEAETEVKAEPEEIEIPSKEKMIETINRRLGVFSEIVDTTPGLSRREEFGKEEPAYYYAPPDGIAMKLEELDEKTLYNLYVKVNQAATRLHTERILGQLRQQEQLRRLQNLQRPPGQIPQQPVQPPKLPQDYLPPRPPRQPAAPPPERR